MENSLIQEYLKELAQIENECAEFSQAHPLVAGRLGLGSEGSVDPHVRQLIEAVAFISARVKRNMDTIPGELVCSLLRLLSPDIVRPVPSMGVVRFSPIRRDTEMLNFDIPANSTLKARAGSEGWCQLAIPRSARLWPLHCETFWGGEKAGKSDRVKGFEQEGCFVVRVSSTGKSFRKGQPGELDLFVTGPASRALAAVETLATGVREIHMVAVGGAWSVRLPLEALQTVGFDRSDERLLSATSAVETLSSAVIEYLASPQRFCFLRLNGLNCPEACNAFDLVLVLDPKHTKSVDAVRDNLVPNCVPVINLFRRSSGALILREFQSEYLLPADSRQPGPWDVYSVDQVRLRGSKNTELPEYYSSVASAASHSLYWTEFRRERVGSGHANATAALALVGVDGSPHESAWSEGDSLCADLSCTNRHLPELLNPGQELDALSVAPNYRATLEIGMSSYVEPLMPSAARLHTLLEAVAFRGMGAGQSLAMVRNFLKIRNRSDGAFATGQIAGLRDIQRTLVAAPSSSRSFRPEQQVGIRYDLHFHDDAQVEVGRYFIGKIVKELMELVRDPNSAVHVVVHGLGGRSVVLD